MNFNNFLKTQREEKILSALFLLSTLFFLWQHSVNFSWDFASYSLNAQYWLGNSSYFEYYRPPLMSFMLLVFGILGSVLAEYTFIVAASVLFLYSTIRLADTLKIDRILFYITLLSPYVLLFGLINGTELLSLALLQLFISTVIERKNNAGIFIALAFLTRFNMAIFSFLLLTRNLRSLFKNAAAFALPIAAWLVFTFITTGNAFTTIADTYAIIFKFREAFQPINLVHLWAVTLYLLPLFVYGLWISLKRLNISLKKGTHFLFTKERRLLVILGVLLLSLYQYYVNPLKDIRYIFTMVVPVAYFSVIALSEVKLRQEQLFKCIIVLLLVVNLVFVISFHYENVYESTKKYNYAIERANGLGINHCRTMSNGWIFMNYLGKVTEPTPDSRIIQNKLDLGYYIILFRSIEEPQWVRNYPFVHEFPVVFEDDELIILGKGICVPPKTVNNTYMERLSNTVLINKNITINTNPCFTLFGNIELMEKTCNFVNLRGFLLDENRYDAANLERFMVK